MTNAIIRFGPSTNPGPIIECSDSLQIIRQHLEEQWAAGYHIAIVEAANFKLIFELGRMAENKGVLKLLPSQR